MKYVTNLTQSNISAYRHVVLASNIPDTANLYQMARALGVRTVTCRVLYGTHIIV